MAQRPVAQALGGPGGALHPIGRRGHVRAPRDHVLGAAALRGALLGRDLDRVQSQNQIHALGEFNFFD